MPSFAAAAEAGSAETPAAESLVKLLYESLTPGQRERICFAWDHQHPEWGQLRSRVSANWNITDETIDSTFYTPDQQELVHAIYRGIIAPEWHERYDQQQDDDSGGFGLNNSIAIFGTPGAGPSELVLTGRHMTLRCDGDSAAHVAFGGPIFYGHDPTGTLEEDPDHPGNVFWPQAVEANKLYQALDGKQQRLALVKTLPGESQVAFRGADGRFDGIPVTELSGDQKGARAGSAPQAGRTVPPERSRRSPRLLAAAGGDRRLQPGVLPVGRSGQRQGLGQLAPGRPLVRLALPRGAPRPRVGQCGGRSFAEAKCLERPSDNRSVILSEAKNLEARLSR
jgi:hypothetical protein